jgi:hypothetical protein
MLEAILSMKGEEILRSIQGARLSSVQFVLDYLILGFDEKGALTTLVWPEVAEGGGALTFGMSGYRDALCGLITQVVDDVEVLDDETILINFRGKGQLRIRLRSYKSPGERAIFTAPKHVLFTW